MSQEISRNSKELFHLLVENVRDFAVFMTDMEGRIISWNPGVERLLGYSEEEFIGQHGSIIFTREDRERRAPEREMEAALNEGRAEDMRWHVRSDGSYFWADGLLMLLRDELGGLHGFAKILRDGTERKLIEARNRFLVRLDDEVRPLEDPEDVTAAAARMLGRHLNADRCVYAEVEPDEDHFLITGDYTRDVPSIVGRFRMSQFGAEALRLMRAGEPYVVTDAETDERVTAEDLQIYRQTQIRASVTVPLHKKGHFVGGMGVHQKSPRRWMPEEIELVAAVANRCWESIERTRTTRELRASEERYRSLLENANDIIYSHDLAGNYLSINRAGERITGYTRAEILGGLNIAQVVAPDNLDKARRMMERKLGDPSPTVYEIDIISRDGHRLTLEVSTRIALRNGVPYAVEGVARDVTRRKRAEAERQKLLELERQARQEAEDALNLQRQIEQKLTLLVEASDVMLGSSSPASVQPAVLDLCRRLISADAYAVWRLDHVKRVWRIVSSAGMSREYAEVEIADEGQSPAALESPVVAEDVLKMPLLATRREMYLAEGIRSLMVAPLRVHGQVSGTLTFYYRQPHRFVETDLRAATALANLAGSAISSAELYEEQTRLRTAAQEAEARSAFLAEAGRILSSTLDYQRTLAQVARLAVPDLADWCTVDLLEEDGFLRRLAVAHVNPSKVEWAHELHKQYPPDPDDPGGVYNVLRTGQSELYPHIPDELLVNAARDEEHLKTLRDIGFSSVMIVPLVAHGRKLGAISFVTAESGRPYGAKDLALAEALAHRAALAIDNARLYSEAREANRLKDEFLATVSHELRTPLTAVIGWLHLIRSGQMEQDAVARALDTVERNARAQAQLINDLLDVSRIVSGKLKIEVRAVELAAVIDSAVTAVRPAADAKHIRLRMLLDPEVPPVLGDPERLQQVVWNLLNNAVKFTPEGGAVEVSTRRTDSHAEIAVSDTGAGVAPEFLPHVFDRFRQADQSTTRRHGGLGLGLAIVRHLTELHGGSVRAESGGIGAGATFIVTLPIAETAPSTRDEALSQTALHEETASHYEPSLEGLRVLLVEDEEDARELIAMALERRGASVTKTRAASEALAALDRSRFDLLVSDIGMPVEDGYSLIRRVRALSPERGGDMPAIALTAYARDEDRVKAFQAGFQAHLPKPVNPAELVAAVATLAGRSGRARP